MKSVQKTGKVILQKNGFYLHLFLCNHSTVYSVQYNIKKHYTDLTGNPCKTQVFVVNLALYIYTYTRTELGLNVNFPGATVQLHLAPKGTKKQLKNNIRIGSSLFTACLQARRPVGCFVLKGTVWQDSYLKFFNIYNLTHAPGLRFKW